MRSARRQILQPGDIRRLIVFAFTILVIVPGCAWLLGGMDHGHSVSWCLIALVVMTLLAFMPGRLMHDVVFAG